LAGENPAPVSTLPPNTVTDIVSGCTSNYTVQSGDTCESIAKANSITVAQFEAWNPTINPNCTNILLNATYCIAGSDSGGTTNNAGSSALAVTSALNTGTGVASTPTTSASSYATTTTVADTVTGSEAIVKVTKTVVMTSVATSATNTTSTISTTSTIISTTSTTISTATASIPANSASAGLGGSQEASSNPTLVSRIWNSSNRYLHSRRNVELYWRFEISTMRLGIVVDYSTNG
jgi:murein DD-endopeptidase MepM/ murein hydrolase activator NlpD